MPVSLTEDVGATPVPAATPSVTLLPVNDVAIVAVLSIAEEVTALLLIEIAADAPTVVSLVVSLATVTDNKGSVTVACALLPSVSVVASRKDCVLVCATTAFRSLAPATIKLPVFLLPVAVADTVLLVAATDTVSAEPAEDRVIPAAPFVTAMIDESTLLCTLLRNRSALSISVVAAAELRSILVAPLVVPAPDASTLMPSATYNVLVAVFCAAVVAMLFEVISTEVVSKLPVTVAAIPDDAVMTALSNTVVPDVPTFSETCTLEIPAVLDRVARPPSWTYRVLAAVVPLKLAAMLLLSKASNDVAEPPVTDKSIVAPVTFEKAVALAAVPPVVEFCTSSLSCVDCNTKPAQDFAAVRP